MSRLRRLFPGAVAVLRAAELDLEPIQQLPILAPRPALPADTADTQEARSRVASDGS